MYANILRATAPLQVIALWDESKVVRAPAGTEHGGEFAAKPRGEELQSFQQKMVAHLQSYEGKPSEVDTKNRQATAHALTDTLATHPAFAGMRIQDIRNFVFEKLALWEGTSGDSEPAAIQMQWAVKREFGLEHAPMEHLNQEDIAKEVMTLQRSPKENARCQAFVRAEYERTQAWFKEQGITHVTVVRGMPNPEYLGEGQQTIHMQPASSWTTDVNIAYHFSSGDYGQPVMLVTRVPVADVLSTAVTGRGTLREREVILLGKPQEAEVFSAVREHLTKRRIEDFLR